MRQYSLKGLDEIKRNEKNDKYFKLKCLVRPNQLLGVWAKSQKKHVGRHNKNKNIVNFRQKY